MKIVFLEPLGVAQSLLAHKVEEAIGTQHELIFYAERVEEESVLVDRCKDADIAVLSNIPFRRSVMASCPQLKGICVAFTGMDHIDIEYCQMHNIMVMNCAGYSTVAVADLVFGLLIALARNIHLCDGACRSGRTKEGLVGFELEGKRFGVIGLGAIGQRVAKIANAFGCEVVAYNRSPKSVPDVTLVDLPTLLSTSDIVSLHLPLNNETRGIIGAEELSLMKREALLINTARGGLIDTQALTAALHAHTIAGAGIDVFDMEPPIPADYELMHAPHTLFTPHVGFATLQAFEKRADIIAQNLKVMTATTLRG